MNENKKERASKNEIKNDMGKKERMKERKKERKKRASEIQMIEWHGKWKKQINPPTNKE